MVAGKIKSWQKSDVYDVLLSIAKWGVASVIAILISNFIIAKLMISNNFLAILLTAAIVSIVIQAIRSHYNEFSFKMRWFFFHFLVYAVVIWAMIESILPRLGLQTGILSSLIIGLTIAVTIVIIQKIGIRSRTIPWISLVLVLVLLVANLGYLKSIVPIDLPALYQNGSAVPEGKQACPTSTVVYYSTPSLSTSDLKGLINTNVWRIEKNPTSCYKGIYQGQNPDRFYCDNLVVSRWDLSSSGTINYRWYTVVTAEFRLETGGSESLYVLDGLSCENGERVVVDKNSPQIYTYGSKDGTRINIDVSQDTPDVNLKY